MEAHTESMVVRAWR